MPEIKEAIAIFILHENNMRCLHWNCVGHNFMTAHGVAEEYTEHICSDIDKLAEFNDILGNSPNQVNLIEAAKIIEESDKKLFLVDPSKYYSADDVYKCVTIILSDLKSAIEELLDEMMEMMLLEFIVSLKQCIIIIISREIILINIDSLLQTHSQNKPYLISLEKINPLG